MGNTIKNKYFACIYFNSYTHKDGSIQLHHLLVGTDWKYIYTLHRIVILDCFVPFFLTLKLHDTWDFEIDDMIYTFILERKGCLSLFDVTQKKEYNIQYNSQ